mmetsp:Transcript_37776/g.43151  ORF Transcript_37776/g.43151 Transcript_37776/m.43151 type:complete len:221 (-) Transcript_37776:261-923(-)|eukprot:CAMPEP_0194145328 /NCGR_PEP_ID=MMETSP0152-20130528/16835_1 /TAXON_ID=1049557 /ORGANISM="Thalassiothrix antarctica, Strain L6-D1" /LENGTH=220 /DNA_ID=CAMNT_0038845515 /DNA_START=117 /DNA_END=779 /DNA_ORIENTATION=+
MVKNKIVGTVFTALSVDGYVAKRDGDISWMTLPAPVTDGVANPDDGFGFQAFMSSVDCIIMGRVTFDSVLSFGEEMWAYGNKRIIIYTRNPNGVMAGLPPFLMNTGRVSASALPPKELLAQLQKDGHRHAYIDGANTISSFMKEKLINYLHLTRIPVLLGDGIPLFPSQGGNLYGAVTKPPKEVYLSLEENQVHENGMVTGKYQVLYGQNPNKGTGCVIS